MSFWFGFNLFDTAIKGIIRSTVVLRWFYDGFTVVLRWFYAGFLVVLLWFYGVSDSVLKNLCLHPQNTRKNSQIAKQNAAGFPAT